MNPRRYNQIERALAVLDKSTTVDVLKDDPYLLFIFKKAERVTTATYVLTGLMSDTEPLKFELRKSALELLKSTLSFKERANSSAEEFLSETYSRFVEVLSLFEIAYVTDLVSPMNFSLMKRELDSLLAIVAGHGRSAGVPVSPPYLDEAFFGIPKNIFADQDASKGSNISSEEKRKQTEENRVGSMGAFDRLYRNQKDIYKGQDIVTDNVLNRDVARPPASVQRSGIKVVKTDIPHPLSSALREDRKAKIIAFLRQNNVAIIKDFTSVIHGCGEKTIQRLLADLVDSGVLKREGERRWSRYSLVD